MNKALIVVASESDRRLMSCLLTRAGYEPIAVDKGMDYYDEFEQYQYASEPDPKERAGIWQTAIGLQKVDGLNVSDFLVETAKRHIEGEIDIDTVQQLVSGYYQSAQSRERSENDMEADTASSNIVKLLSEPSFKFSVEGLASIHRRIFHNVFRHAGKFRDYDIRKRNGCLMVSL